MKELYAFLNKHTQITCLSLFTPENYGMNWNFGEVQSITNSIFSLPTLSSLRSVGNASLPLEASQKLLNTISSNSSLTKLALPGNNIRDTNILRGNSAITSLNLYNNSLLDDAIPDFLAMPQLTYLDIGENPIFNLGGISFLTMTSLRYLIIGIPTASFTIQHAEAIATSTTLTSLTICYNFSEGPSLEPLKRMTSLQQCLSYSHYSNGPIKAMEVQISENKNNLKARRNDFVTKLIQIALARIYTPKSAQLPNIPLDLLPEIFKSTYRDHLLTETESRELIRDIVRKGTALRTWLDGRHKVEDLQVYKSKTGIKLLFSPIRTTAVLDSNQNLRP